MAHELSTQKSVISLFVMRNHVYLCCLHGLYLGSICCMMHGTHIYQFCFFFFFLVNLKVDRTCRLAMVKTTYKLIVI
jgi:hypothetical protein